MNYSPKKLNELLKDNNFSFKKKFGQNFIIDENIINSIIKKSDIDLNTFVIEVGPGSGSLTNKLALSSKNVLCYEIDESLKPFLSKLEEENKNVKVKYEDFLKSNVLNDIKGYDYNKLYLVANLPYYITTPIITKIIEDDIPVDKMVVMVQKEVGDRFKALPKSKDYNSLTIYLNYYFNVKKVMDVSKNVFMPKPNVDSIVVEFTRKEELPYLKDKKVFFKLIRDAFKQKRKTIKNNLREYDLNKIEEVLLKNDLSLNSRAEEISLEVFIEISNNL